jgi:hypothetical protein
MRSTTRRLHSASSASGVPASSLGACQKTTDRFRWECIVNDARTHSVSLHSAVRAAGSRFNLPSARPASRRTPQNSGRIQIAQALAGSRITENNELYNLRAFAAAPTPVPGNSVEDENTIALSVQPCIIPALRLLLRLGCLYASPNVDPAVPILEERSPAGRSGRSTSC